jgi:glycerone phosphate O-acyltransferase/fatty acyl-CoA reductase
VTAETLILFVSSLIWPMIDSYYISLLFTLSMLENKSIEASVIVKKIQWLAETLYEEKIISFYESCNIESFKNAV